MRLTLTSVAVTAWVLGKPAFAKFGVTTKGNAFSVDTDGGLVFDVNKRVSPILLPSPPTFGFLSTLNLETRLTRNGFRSNGDITSLLYNGVQYQGTSKMTAINSGLSSAQVTAETVGGREIPAPDAILRCSAQ
jgi:rhamnogalacturonan endolyase